MMKIVADENIPYAAECFGSVGQVQLLSGRSMTAEAVREADAVLVRSITKVGAELLKGSRVKFIGTVTIGFEHIDTDFLKEHDIGFASAPGSNANSTAEYVVAALLSVGRKKKIELAGKSIGIVGVGNVGCRVARKAAALGMRVLLNDPPLQRQTQDAKYLSLEKLFDCDFITLHTPLTFEGVDRTFHLADEKFFKSLKTGCVFINSSRGAVADTNALKDAIESGGLKASVVDVWENEPDIDMELLRMVDISTPHIAGYSFDGKAAGMIMIYEAFCRHFGLEANKSIEDFLPEPVLPEIHIDPESDTEQNLLHEIVQQVYAIDKDDFNMREIAMVPQAERASFFDDLRRNYPVRREFGNTLIVLDRPHDSLAGELGGIGFKV